MLSKYYSFKYKEKKDQWPKLWCVNAVHPWFKKKEIEGYLTLKNENTACKKIHFQRENYSIKCL